MGAVMFFFAHMDTHSKWKVWKQSPFMKGQKRNVKKQITKIIRDEDLCDVINRHMDWHIQELCILQILQCAMTGAFTFIRQSVPPATATYPSLVTLVILRRKSTEFRLGGFHLRMSSHLPGLYGCGRGGQKGERFGWPIAINTWLRCYRSETDNQLFLLLLLSS